MSIDLAAIRSGLREIVSGDAVSVRAVMLIAAKGAFLVMLTVMIATYAVAVSQATPPPPEPLPPYIYS